MGNGSLIQCSRSINADVGARLADTASDPLRDVTEQSERPRFQLAVTRCHDPSRMRWIHRLMQAMDSYMNVVVKSATA
jgi:hypothetical protein